MQNPIFENVKYLLRSEESRLALLNRLETEVDHSLNHDSPLTALCWTGQILEALRDQDQPAGNEQLEEVTGRIAAKFSSWIVKTYGGSIQQAETPIELSEKQGQGEEYCFAEKFDDLPNWGVAKWAFFQNRVEFLSVLSKSSSESLTKAVEAFGQIQDCFDKLPSNRQEQVIPACDRLVSAIRDALESMVETMKDRA